MRRIDWRVREKEGRRRERGKRKEEVVKMIKEDASEGE